MRVFRGSGEVSGEIGASVVAIGSFDGIHVGHQALFRRALELAQQERVPAVVLTFDPHPARFFQPELAPPLITTEEQKLGLLRDSGVDAVIIEPFDRELADLSPEQFVQRTLEGALGARHVVVGSTFTFGRERAGNLAELQQLGGSHGFIAHGIRPVRVDSIVVSSTKIREFVLMGRVDGASMLLGRPFFVEGRVVHGAGRGRTLGIRTANVEADNELLPARGVYAGRGRTDDGNTYGAVINVGHAPTFGGGGPVQIEAHLLDYSGDLSWRRMRVVFLDRLRDEKRFGSADQLVEAIRRDIAATRQLLER